MDGGDPQVIASTVAAVTRRLTEQRRHDIGFPGGRDLAFPELADLMTSHMLNNVGDPYRSGFASHHTHPWECEVVDTVASWLRAPAGHWGYVTSGSTEGNLHAMAEAARCLPDLVVYMSVAAHYSLPKAARLLRLPTVVVGVDPGDAMNIDDLGDQLALRRDRPAMVVATAGTTMAEAVDNVAAITAVCDRLAITRRRIHVDAALSGLPLALLADDARPPFDFAWGATSMVVSGHKFLSTMAPCGVLVYAQHPYQAGAGLPAYIGSPDTTVTGSRSGHLPLVLWRNLTLLGREGHHQRAVHARQVAEHAVHRLREIGWQAYRHPHAFTVVLDRPPDGVLAKWPLARDTSRCHIVCMPGVGKDQIDEFVDDVANHASGLPRRVPAAVAVPSPRLPSLGMADTVRLTPNTSS